MWGEVKSLGEILTDNGVGYYAQKAKIKIEFKEIINSGIFSLELRHMSTAKNAPKLKFRFFLSTDSGFLDPARARGVSGMC